MNTPEQSSDDYQPERIDDSEYIIRRVSKIGIQERPGIGITANSGAVRPRPNETECSWSRKKITSPQQLISIEQDKGVDVRGRHVAEVQVIQLREIGLDVKLDETGEDPGHCLVFTAPPVGRSNKVWSKLARLTRIIYTHGD